MKKIPRTNSLMRRVMGKANALLETRGIFICHTTDPIMRNITIYGGNYVTKRDTYITFSDVDILPRLPHGLHRAVISIPHPDDPIEIRRYEA